MINNFRKNCFYIVMIIAGFILLLFDLTPGHCFKDHIHIYQNDPDILAGVILVFFGGFELGKRLI